MMNPAIFLLAGMSLGLRTARWLADRKQKEKARWLAEPGYPARWVEVNGFRYVLDERKECGGGR